MQHIHLIKTIGGNATRSEIGLCYEQKLRNCEGGKMLCKCVVNYVQNSFKVLRDFGRFSVSGASVLVYEGARLEKSTCITVRCYKTLHDSKGLRHLCTY